MTLAEARLSDVTAWARGNLILVVLLVIGTILLTRFASWAGGRYLARIDAQASDSDELVRSETLKHRHAVTQVVTWSLLVIIYCVVAVLIVQLLGLPISSFVAPASIVGVAIGFGAQRVVQDILAGFFIVSERQYGYGDIITLAVTGNNTLSTGTVEEVTLRTTRMRSLSGEVITTPNGQIVQVTNLSRDWARVVVDVPVPARVDVGHVTEHPPPGRPRAVRGGGDAAAAARPAQRDGGGEPGGRPLQPAGGGQDPARQAVRGRPGPAGPDHAGLPA